MKWEILYGKEVFPVCPDDVVEALEVAVGRMNYAITNDKEFKKNIHVRIQYEIYIQIIQLVIESFHGAHMKGMKGEIIEFIKKDGFFDKPEGEKNGL